MLKKISEHIMLYACSTLDIGLHKGKMGAVIYFYYLTKYTGKQIYAGFAKELLDQLYEIININHSLHFADGLSGIAWGVDYLIYNRFVDPDSNDVLDELDDQILKMSLNYIDKTDLLYGLKGYAYYAISRYDYNKSIKNKEYYNYVNSLLEKFGDSEGVDKEDIYLCDCLNKILIGDDVQNLNNVLFSQIINSVIFDQEAIFNNSRPLGILNNGYSGIGLKIMLYGNEKNLHIA